ncbi:kinase-like domain-containing protein [Nemania abortiva]|nr:kinase-like domain-containing protein [Nemania abortiva]
MVLRPGYVLKGSRATYKLHQALKSNTVFKAEVLDGAGIDSKWAVVKTSSTDLERALLHREFSNYQIPEISRSPYIRRLHEAIGPFFYRPYWRNEPPEHINHQHYLIFEWMDADLWHVPSRPYRGGGSKLPRIVSKSILEALGIFRKLGKAHTDINPNNIMVSGLEEDTPTVKVADLGMLISEGPKEKRLQCIPCRAPEVWKGLGVFHSSDIWSVGVTLAHWLRQATIFGASDKIIEGLTEAWCIAKLHLLVGPMGEYHGSPEIEEEWDVAGQLKDMDVGPPIGKLVKVQTLRKELERIVDPPVPSSIIDFIESLLIIDPSKRPTAEEAQQHPFLSGS